MQSNILIRPARLDDAAFVAPLICEAMGDLVEKFTNGSLEKGIGLFTHFFQKKDNQYSYENCQIAQYEGTDAGMVLTYDGGKLNVLRQPFLDYIAETFALKLKNIEDETQAGELYIDCVAVLPGFRGKSIGTTLLNAAIQKSQDLSLPSTGLIVDVENEKALQLYQRMGFIVQEKKNFAGSVYIHMQYPNPR